VAAQPQPIPDAVNAGNESELQRLRSLLELRSTFLQLTVHELRRPLGIANGYLSMMEDGTFGRLPESAAPALQQMAGSLAEMAELLSGLAAVARLEDGSGVLTLQRCRLWRVLAVAAEAARVEADAKQVDINLRVSAMAPDVRADPERLHIALVNLLTNAIKYAPAGSRVDLEAHAEDSSGQVVIGVTDQGPGIAQDEAERVFEKFVRGSQAGQSPGLGLGLYIVRRIVELHGGRVMLRSAPGHGAMIAIVLPAFDRRGPDEPARDLPPAP
jgi:signal transduction histidine kinase